MITFNEESRKEFVEAQVQEILGEFEKVLRAKLNQMTIATELAAKVAIKAAEQGRAEQEEDEEAEGCEECPIRDVCPGADEDEDGKDWDDDALQRLMDAIFSKDEQSGEEEEEEEADEEEEDEAGTPTVNVTTKNLNPAQKAAVYRFLAEMEKLGENPKGSDKGSGKEKPAKK